MDLIGTTLNDRYRILGSLGKGGMGHVYAAVHMTLEQRVAIKALHPRFAKVEHHRARFLQEARAASRIRHPSVVEIKDFGHTPNGSVYFVMEYLQGRDMSVELRRHGALRWARVRSILLQAASALRAAHAQQVIHRDIKPANCFLLDDEDTGVRDVIKLLDFGIAKIDSGSHSEAPRKGITGISEVLGTASYMSPEQARSEPLDARSDMYSLGIMAYELLTGQVPFKGSNVLRLMAAHLEQQPPPLRDVAPGVPAAVEAVVLKMLAKAPGDRYESMKALSQALRAIPETAGKRITKPWLPGGGPRQSTERAPKGTQTRGSMAVGVGLQPDDDTLVVQLAEFQGGRPVGEQTAVVMARARAAASPASSSAQAPVALAGARKRARILVPPRPSASASSSLAGGSSLLGLAPDERAGSSSTSLMAMASESLIETKPGTIELTRAKRIRGGLALLGLLGLLVGGGSVLVTKVWLAEEEARKSGGAAERADGGATHELHRTGDPGAPHGR
jgi:serine/threonine protein kinase